MTANNTLCEYLNELQNVTQLRKQVGDMNVELAASIPATIKREGIVFAIDLHESRFYFTRHHLLAVT